MSNESFKERLERLRAGADEKRAAKQATTGPAFEFDADLIPDLERGDGAQPVDIELDSFLGGIDILDAYRKWCGKMEPKVGNKREGIKISCPIPGHLDAHPSAWVNLDEQVWVCGPCEQGGDKYDFAAWHFGHGVPAYKTDGSFPDLRREMAVDFGYTVVRSGKTEWLEPPERPVGTKKTGQKVQETPFETVASDDIDTGESAQVINFPDFTDEPEVMPVIDWQGIVKPDTFLWQWMEHTEQYDLPTEYFFWLGCQAVAGAIGDLSRLMDFPPVEANLYICLTGPTGIGKSRATGVLVDQLRESLTYDKTDPNTKGVLIAKQPASGEALLKIFSRAERDPSDPKVIVGYRQVIGLVRFDELASLTGKASRLGNTLKSQIIGLYDGDTQGDSAMTRDDTEIENPFCQMLTTTQPRKIRDLLTQGDADSGFLNRWIFAMGPAKKLLSYGRKPFDPAACSWALKEIHAHASFGHDYRLAGSALAEWTDFFEQVVEPLKISEDANPIYSRIDLTMFKLILIFAANERATAITIDHVRSAIDLWPYLRDTYAIVSGRIGNVHISVEADLVDECADVVYAAIPELKTKIGKDPSKRDLWQLKLKGKKCFSQAVFAKALALLLSLEFIEEILSVKTDKRSATRYRVTPEARGSVLQSV